VLNLVQLRLQRTKRFRCVFPVLQIYAGIPRIAGVVVRRIFRLILWPLLTLPQVGDLPLQIRLPRY
jgi:hypothetical protein